jgi:alpha-beta hydrolase superfamily lysophospholipase
VTEDAFTGRNCVVERAITADGYSTIAEADPALVSRKRLGANGALEEDPTKVVRPTVSDVQGAMTKISAFADRIDREVPDSVRRRELFSGSSRGNKMDPYCLFHAPGKAIYGTVVLFHGFNDRPHQQAKLGSYLFHNGFNVYNVYLANMYMVEGTDFWPKTTYKPELLVALQRKLAAPAVQTVLQPILPRLQAGTMTEADTIALDRILAPELSTSMVKAAWTNPGGDAWKQLMATNTPVEGQSLPEAARTSDFMAYVKDATDRIADLSDMPGPVFVSGLSVGGTVALAAAAADGGRRVKGVVSHAPWLQSIDAKNNTQVMIAGPLDKMIGAAGGTYPMKWESHQISFSPASISATLALGAWTAKPENVRTLAQIPTAQVVTEDEDSADNAASGALQTAFTSDPRVAGLHARVTYPKALRVRHAITDPENYKDGDPAGPSWNRYWRTLYQESFRFYTTGAMNQENLVRREVDPALPKPACAMPDFPHRCGE